MTNHQGQPLFQAIHPKERPEGSPVRIMKMKGGVTLGAVRNTTGGDSTGTTFMNLFLGGA